jgi:ATP-dependent RNA helicase DOB1
MNANDLFSFLDDTRPSEDVDKYPDEDGVQFDVPNKQGLKRKAGPPSPSTNHSPVVGVEAHLPESKRLRTEPANPILLDDFETEAKREVAASAGLTGADEAGTRLELRHQVSSHHPTM